MTDEHAQATEERGAPAAAARPRRFRWLARILFVVVSLLVALFAVDKVIHWFDLFGVRHGDRVLRYRAEVLQPTWSAEDLDGTLFVHRPNVDVDFGPLRVVTNARGFRGPEIAVPKPDGVCRILVLGDSVAFGWGVDDEVTFLRQFEQELNDRAGAAGPRYEVVNTGHLMYDTVQQRALLERQGFETQPDLVVVVYVVNDVEPTRDLVEVLLGLREVPAPTIEPSTFDEFTALTGSWFPSIAKVMSLFSLKTRNWEQILDEHGGEFRAETEGSGVRGWERSRDALRAMRDGCAEREIPFVVLDHSYPPIRSLPEFCRAEGIPYEDLAFTPEELEQPIYNSAMDPHANALGQTMLLEKLERAWSTLQLPGAK